MKNGHVLYISDHHVHVLAIHSKHVALEQDFIQDDDGFQQFEQYLRSKPFSNITVLVNSRHEEYRLERIPKLYRGDRQALLSHKRKRLFPGIDYTCATSLGSDKRSSESREQERILFSCLAAPDLIQPWIGLLLNAKVPIRGIASLPLLSQSIVNYLPQENQVLLVTYTHAISDNNPHGLRQAYFAKQQLLMSRLIPLQDLSATYYTNYVLPEIFKTQQYLNGQSLAREDQALHIVILLPAAEVGAFEQLLAHQKISDTTRYYLIEVEQLFQLSGVDGEASRDENGLLYFSSLMAWYAHQQGKNHYAQASETRYALYKRLREAVWLLALLVILSGVAYASKVLFEALSVRDEIRYAQQQSQSLHQQYQAAQQHATLDVPVDVIHIKNTVDVAAYVQGLYRDPYRSLSIVSTHLNDYPSLSLEKIAWQTLERPIQKPNFAAKLRNSARLRAPKQETETIEILSLQGYIKGAEGDAIRALRTLKNFIAQVKENPSVEEIKMIDSPINLASQNLSGAAGQTQSLPKAIFKLEFIFKFADSQ